MAGSFRHLLDVGTGAYRGTELIENVGDASEALMDCFDVIAFVMYELRAMQGHEAWHLHVRLRERLGLDYGDMNPNYPINEEE